MAFVHKQKSDKIVLKGACLQKEHFADAVILPGHLVELATTGNIRVQSTAGADCRRAVATENSLIGGSKNTEYAAEGNVFTALCPPGAEVQLRVAPGYFDAIAIGDALIAAADGTVTKRGTTGTIIAFALESIDRSKTTEEAFILSEIK